jgi:hypothetical protein
MTVADTKPGIDARVNIFRQGSRGTAGIAMRNRESTTDTRRGGNATRRGLRAAAGIARCGR